MFQLIAENKMLKLLFFLLIAGFSSYTQPVKIPQIDFSPQKYVCYRTVEVPVIDGILNETTWSKAGWTNNFVDIRGYTQDKPRFLTCAKMLWDEDYFYIAAELTETDIWGTLKNHDDKIYNDNAFEIFIDPDSDTQMYSEIEINVLNTVWDLLLIKPYRDIKNPALGSWNIKGLKTGVAFKGTCNNFSDKDSNWTVEVAIPWETFKEISEVNIPPVEGDQWRVNFLRVEWETEIKNGEYQKLVDETTNKYMKPGYWCWSPQGVVNMHYPEMWGFVQFSKEVVGVSVSAFNTKKEEAAKWFLRCVYYSERNYFSKHGKFTKNLDELNLQAELPDGYKLPPEIECSSDMFEAWLLSDDNYEKITITSDGLVLIIKLQ